ncbi:class I SAM-dependent methyltransferase [Catenulispora pinisilvae]|uniref:class I SAM-dependent methyltransferase n=1 Tax=Catenulispora pinisilvae TaxID=2705253 RepID=UPI0018914E10|nr:class I SAM-dependent methyltransferase [Catenulispora pinisilvae]
MEALEAASLPYRRPEFYAALTDVDAPHTAALITAMVYLHGPAGASSVLDIGCGTGAVLEELAKHYPTAVGVDLLPGMVEVASARRAMLDVRQGDMRNVRLRQMFDVVACVGNALAYMVSPEDTAAAFTTFAEHCPPGGLLLVQTLMETPELGVVKTTPVFAGDRAAVATITYNLDPVDGTLVMTRSWAFAGGETAVDVIRRRALTPDELVGFAISAGFRSIEPQPWPKHMTAFLREDQPCGIEQKGCDIAAGDRPTFRLPESSPRERP